MKCVWECEWELAYYMGMGWDGNQELVPADLHVTYNTSLSIIQEWRMIILFTGLYVSL